MTNRNSQATPEANISETQDGRALCSVKTAAKAWDCPTSSVYDWIARGYIPTVKLGRAVRIPAHVVQAVCESGFEALDLPGGTAA